ncbi:hypothetical protein [Moraxella lacunata]|uniref:Uncharacterized protein n=1 Tax=Moraxella lacunata TaxID=477 RepID=A0A1B8Q2H6_MORLA|nr:hypothetical protein A9309_06130 [Moraxella lacunata]
MFKLSFIKHPKIKGEKSWLYLANIYPLWQGVNCYLIKMAGYILADFTYFYTFFVTIVTDDGEIGTNNRAYLP